VYACICVGGKKGRDEDREMAYNLIISLLVASEN